MKSAGIADPATIAYFVLNMLLAGRDTVRPFPVSPDHNRVTITQTASVLSFLVYFLALHPEVAEKLRAEILLAYGSDGQPSSMI